MSYKEGPDQKLQLIFKRDSDGLKTSLCFDGPTKEMPMALQVKMDGTFSKDIAIGKVTKARGAARQHPYQARRADRFALPPAAPAAMPAPVPAPVWAAPAIIQYDAVPFPFDATFAAQAPHMHPYGDGFVSAAGGGDQHAHQMNDWLHRRMERMSVDNLQEAGRSGTGPLLSHRLNSY